MNYYRCEELTAAWKMFSSLWTLIFGERRKLHSDQEGLKETAMYLSGLRDWLKLDLTRRGASLMFKGWALTPVWGGDMDQIRPHRKGWALCRTNIDKPRRESGKALTQLDSLALAQAAFSLGIWLWLLFLQSSQSPQS